MRICWCGSTVEQLICNQQVGGSIPSTSSNKKEKNLLDIYKSYGIIVRQTKFRGIPEWPKGADCKSVS